MHFVDQKTLKAIYHTIFESHLYCSSAVWAQNFNYTKRVFSYKKGLSIMSFLRREARTNPLFKDFNILKFHDKIVLENSINPLNIKFRNHLITGLDFSQIFIPTTQSSQIWAALMYLLTDLNYMEENLFVLVQFSLGIFLKIFMEIFFFIS